MKVSLISLGCDKNLVDSEMMLGMLRDAGHELTDDVQEAEAIIINTCCFIHDAKEESIETILQMGELKQTGKLKRLIVTGCLAERYAKEMHEQMPEVDAILGTTAYEEIIKAMETDDYYEVRRDLTYLPMPEAKRVTTTGAYVSYLKIAEGCDKCCTYCIIPKIRGPYRSVPMERLIREAEELAAAGTKELILVAQETTLYGMDLTGKKLLPELLRKLCQIDGIEWIRLLYCYPEEINDELVAVMKQEPKICHYLDMPIQHASDAVLKRMGRKTTQKEIRERIAALRREIPDITLRTTMITGFPGETEEDFNELLAFVSEMRFDRLGAFPYSKEENTAAAKMKEQVPKRIRERRKNAVMRLQKTICREHSESQVGKTLSVIVDGYLPDEGVYVGRTYMDAPTVDGTVFFETGAQLMSGDILPIRIIGANEYDLIGEVNEDEFTK